MLPSHTPGDQQIGYIRTGNEQNQTERNNQRQKYRTDRSRDHALITRNPEAEILACL